MSAKPDFVPERSYLDRRINRAYERMLAAKSSDWQHAWGDSFVSNVRARNAQRTPAEIRALEKERGLA